MVKKWLAAALMMSSSVVGAQVEDDLVAKYQNARIAVTYKGNVGDLAQQLAQQLGIPYYAVQHQATVQVRLKQDNTQTIQHLLDETNRQLMHQNLRFDVLDDKVVLALIGKDVKTLSTPQFIGEVIFVDGQAPKTEPLSPVDELNHISAPVLDNETPKDANALSPVQEIGEEAAPSAEIEAEVKKLQAILEMSQDEKLLAQYAKRKQPLFTLDDKKVIGLDTIRSTKISTFLIFNEGVNTRDYKFDGDFQDIARLDNVVAILHRQKSPPRSFVVTTPDGKKQTIQRAP